jgi:ATP-dependent DNA helicase 2 subunit 1
VTKTFLRDTGEILMPQDLKKTVTFGGRQIYFENNEVAEVKLFDKPGRFNDDFVPCLLN